MVRTSFLAGPCRPQGRYAREAERVTVEHISIRAYDGVSGAWFGLHLTISASFERTARCGHYPHLAHKAGRYDYRGS